MNVPTHGRTAAILLALVAVAGGLLAPPAQAVSRCGSGELALLMPEAGYSYVVQDNVVVASVPTGGRFANIVSFPPAVPYAVLLNACVIRQLTVTLDLVSVPAPVRQTSTYQLDCVLRHTIIEGVFNWPAQDGFAGQGSVVVTATTCDPQPSTLEEVVLIGAYVDP